MKIFIKNKKSFALILAVFVLLAFSVTGMTAISLLSRRTATYLGVLDNQKALYLAESATDFFLEYVVPFENDLTTGNPNITRTLGGTNSTFSILYGTRTAKTASVTLRGTVVKPAPGSSDDFNRDISLTITEDLTQNQNIVANLKKYSAFLGDPNPKNLIPTYVCTYFSCNFCFCHAGYWITSQFFGNTYANNYLSTSGGPAPTVWGSSTSPKNLYVQNNLSLVAVTDGYGVFGNTYAGGTITGSSTVFHGTKNPSCTCASNPTECCWPTKAPIPIAMNTYYYRMFSRASSSNLASLTINTTNTSDPYRSGLNYRNIFVIGNVTITSNSSNPLNGPGNIISFGTITINSGSYIGDRIGLITTQGVTVNGTCRIGGVLSGSYISGQGITIYAQNDVLITGPSLLKAFILAPTSGTVDNQVSTDSTAQLQGLIYTELLPSINGNIYGNVYTDNIENDSLTRIVVYDNIPGVGTTESFRPIQIRGLYNPGMSFQY